MPLTTSNFTKSNPVLLFLALLLSAPCFSQSLEWVKQLGGSNEEYSKTIALDPQGNIVSIGYFTGSADFDPGPDTFLLTSSGGRDIYLQKLDTSGHLVWAKRFGAAKIDNANSVTVDGAGNIYLIGNFQDTVDFDPGPGVAEVATLLSDIFILKLDKDGNLIWIKQSTIQEPTLANGAAIAVDAAGNVYTTGDFRKSVDFDPGMGTTVLTAAGTDGAGDVFIQKLDVDGNLVWVRQVGGSGYDTGYSIAVDPDGNVYTTGYFRGQMDIDPGPGTVNVFMNGISDIFILKLNASGDYVWGKTMGGSQWDGGASIVVAKDGGILSTGDFIGTVDFDPGTPVFNLISISDSDIYIQKLDSDGNFVWAKRMGGSGGSGGACIRLDTIGNIYTAGSFNNGLVDFDPGTSAANLVTNGYKSDAFVHKLNADGSFAWAKRMGGKEYDFAESIAVDPAGNVFVTGRFDGTADFDPESGGVNLTSNGLTDVYVAKLNQRWNFHGTVYNDLNLNQAQDPGEPGIAGVILYVPDRGLFVTSGSDGRYHFYTDLSGDTIRIVMPKPYWSVATAFGVPDSAQTAMDFAVSIQPDIRDVSITSIELLFFRAGFETEMVIQVKNNGSVSVDSFPVVFDIFNHPSPVQFLSATPAPVLVSGDSLVWIIDSLGLSQTAFIRIRLKTSANLSINTLISYQALALLENDAFFLDNTFGGRSAVVGSFDPNDKHVTPEIIAPGALDTTDLRYVIRFQNTGNYPADFVIIRDTLPESLDVSTLTVMAASHDYSWRLFGERILEVRFDPIFLPDSNSNEPASHGFVAFAVKSKSAVAEGDSVSNRAGIYFDYNPPVITNYAVLQVKTTTSVSAAHPFGLLEIVLSPNPVARNSAIRIQLPPGHTDDAGIAIFDINGRLVRQVFSPAASEPIQLNGLPAGVYNIQVRIGGLAGSKLLVVE